MSDATEMPWDSQAPPHDTAAQALTADEASDSADEAWLNDVENWGNEKAGGAEAAPETANLETSPAPTLASAEAPIAHSELSATHPPPPLAPEVRTAPTPPPPSPPAATQTAETELIPQPVMGETPPAPTVAPAIETPPPPAPIPPPPTATPPPPAGPLQTSIPPPVPEASEATPNAKAHINEEALKQLIAVTEQITSNQSEALSALRDYISKL